MRFSRAVLGLGLLLWGGAALWRPLTVPEASGLLAVALTALYGEKRSLYVPGYGALNLGECLYFAAALAWGPVTGGALAALLGLAADRLNRKQAKVVVFNLGWALTTFTLVGLVGQPVLAAGAYALAAGALQALAQSRFESMPLGRTAAMQAQGMKLQAPAVFALGSLGAMLLGPAPWAVLLLGFPVEVGSAYVRMRELHRALQEAQARMLASERQAALGLMAAGVAHEINNPLAAMATALHMLRRHPGDSTCLDLLEKGLERCRGITRRMLVYAREPGQSEARSDVGAVLQDALLLGSHREVRALGLEDLPPVACEPGELVQILANLLANARDAGGEVEIAARVSGRDLEIRVRDSGAGIPPEARDRLFTPFFTTKPVGQGTGLGLFLSRGLALGCGGSLELERTGPDGTTMRLRLPLA